MSETIPSDTQKLLQRLDNLIIAQRRAEVATLAAALLSGRRKSLSIAEMLNVVRDIQFAQYPQPLNPDYQDWEFTKDERLNLVYK